MENPFILPNEAYERDLNVVAAYQHDAAKYLALRTGQPIEVCLDYVRQVTHPGQPTGFKDPKALVLVKNKQGDREATTMSFMRFLGRVNKEKLLLSPSMAAYLPEQYRQSTHAQYIEEGVKNRKRVKGEMFDAERDMAAAIAAGNDALAAQKKELAMVKKGEQNNLKINNNSYSGATVSTATILYYKSTHSSLTSTCRTATSYANASNEKFLAGNRHYYDPEITKANLLALISAADLGKVQQTCDTFGLVYPSADQVVEMVRHSSDLYWQGETHLQAIAQMAANMTPVERAAVVYISDLYHLHKFNPEFTVNFLMELSQPGEASAGVSEDEFKAYDEDIRLLANFINYDVVGGRDKKALLAEAPEVYEQIKATARRAVETLNRYRGLIEAFWLTRSVPSSVHAFPSAYRKAAVISDTDSTMFTMQYWVEQCFGNVSFSAPAKRVVFAVVFLVSEMVLHILAIQSANMGVTKKLRLLAMKNEFYFAVLSMTTRSKHYYASRDAQEGLMKARAELEVKGVGLRDSKVPKRINDTAKEMMEEIIATIKAEQELDMRDILKRIADIEREIIASINNGSYEYMTTGQVKAKESYKNEDNATYQQYEMWRDVFAPYLGMTKEPPYSVVKVSLAVNNRTELDEWCVRMNNPYLANKLKEWMLAKKRKDLSTLLIPYTVVETSGIPKEIVAGVDIRKIIFNTMGVFYLMLESLGIFMQDKKITRLISDYY
jgi:hypothetical protein